MKRGAAGMGRGRRALIMVIALLLAAVAFLIAADEAHKLSEASLLPHGPAALAPYLIALSGSVVFTFAVHHALLLMHTRRELSQAPAWSKLDPQQRAARIAEKQAVLSFRTWMGATFIAIAGLHAALWEPLLASLLVLQVEAIALAAASALIVLFGWLWLRIIRPADTDATGSDQLVSTRRWILHPQFNSTTTLLLLWLFGLATAATVVRGILAPRPIWFECILQGILAAVIVWSALGATFDWWRQRGRAVPSLRMLREGQGPVTFIGMLDFSQPLPPRLRSGTWLAELRASYWVYGRWPWKTWFNVSAPFAISRDARSGSFKLVLNDLPPPPSSLLNWSIVVHAQDSRASALYFSLPREALYVEDAPTQPAPTPHRVRGSLRRSTRQ